MGLRTEGGGLILKVQSLTWSVCVCVINAGGCVIETQGGSCRIFRKERMPETALAGLGTWVG